MNLPAEQEHNLTTSKPMSKPLQKPTAEELRWHAAAENPARIKRHLKRLYILLGIWCALTVGWSIAAVCGVFPIEWANIIILSAGFLNIGIGIVNNRRILAGKKPW